MIRKATSSCPLPEMAFEQQGMSFCVEALGSDLVDRPTLMESSNVCASYSEMACLVIDSFAFLQRSSSGHVIRF